MNRKTSNTFFAGAGSAYSSFNGGTHHQSTSTLYLEKRKKIADELF
jgi:hypothetical protein